LARLSIRVPHFSQLTLPVGVSITVTLYLAPQSQVCVPVSHSTNSVMPGICAPIRKKGNGLRSGGTEATSKDRHERVAILLHQGAKPRFVPIHSCRSLRLANRTYSKRNRCVSASRSKRRHARSLGAMFAHEKPLPHPSSDQAQSNMRDGSREASPVLRFIVAGCACAFSPPGANHACSSPSDPAK
jgi:hypothetical protein